MSKADIQKQRQKELKQLTKPLMAWLHRYYNPHATVTVQIGVTELSLGEICVNVEYEEIKRIAKETEGSDE